MPRVNFTTFLRKIWLKFLTDKPYQIKKFNTLIAQNASSRIDVAENASGVLIKEPGAIINYCSFKGILYTPIVDRYIDNSKRYKDAAIFKEPDRILYSVTGGCILGQLGVVYMPEKRAYIAESAKEWLIDLADSPYTNLINFPPQTELKGITLSCLTNSADGGFYHFIFESIVKIYFCKEIIKDVDHILFNGPVTEWKIKWLRRADIDLTKVIWMEYTGHYKCEQLLFTNRLIADQQISNWCINSLKSLFNISPFVRENISACRKVLLISRKGFSRNIAWEDDILSEFPFIEQVDFFSLNEAETIKKMQEATHVIGPHGAGLSNIYLCRPGTKILEMYPNGKTYQPCYYRTCVICELSYSVVYLDFDNRDVETSGLTKLKEVLPNFLN